jgi:hypothetical protein
LMGKKYHFQGNMLILKFLTTQRAGFQWSWGFLLSRRMSNDCRYWNISHCWPCRWLRNWTHWSVVSRSWPGNITYIFFYFRRYCEQFRTNFYFTIDHLQQSWWASDDFFYHWREILQFRRERICFTGN